MQKAKRNFNKLNFKIVRFFLSAGKVSATTPLTIINDPKELMPRDNDQQFCFRNVQIKYKLFAKFLYIFVLTLLTSVNSRFFFFFESDRLPYKIQTQSLILLKFCAQKMFFSLLLFLRNNLHSESMNDRSNFTSSCHESFFFSVFYLFISFFDCIYSDGEEDMICKRNLSSEQKQVQENILKMA